MNTGWWDSDIHGCYSLVKIAFAPICACKNNRWIWRHNASVLHSRDVTDQLWWRHNTKSENTVLSDNGGISDQIIEGQCAFVEHFYMYIHIYREREREKERETHKLSIMSNLQTHYRFKLNLANVDQHIGCKWLMHGTKDRKDNQYNNFFYVLYTG